MFRLVRRKNFSGIPGTIVIVITSWFKNGEYRQISKAVRINPLYWDEGGRGLVNYRFSGNGDIFSRIFISDRLIFQGELSCNRRGFYKMSSLIGELTLKLIFVPLRRRSHRNENYAKDI